MASKWQPDLILLERLAYQGLTDKQIADYFGVHVDVLQHFKSIEKNNIHKTITSGRSRSLDLASQKLMQKIEDGNIHALMFYLKTKGGWAEAKETSEEPAVKLPASFTFSPAKA